jgi:hypothetical protein
MRFDFTPEEAQPTAEAIVKHLQRMKISVSVEASAWPEAPLRTTLLAKRAGVFMLIEVQSVLNYSGTLKTLANWIAAKRHNAELSMAVPSEANLKAGIIEELKSDGVGLWVVAESGSVQEAVAPKNPALIVNPEPALKYGKCKQEVNEAIRKFNEVNRKDGLRDMCELVERETEALAVLSAKTGRLKMSAADVVKQDWSSQINTLASPNAYHPGVVPIIDDKLKTDMHSFRGARNLIDHKAKNKQADLKRQMQFAERMMQGPRLIAELMTLQRKIR